MKSAREVTASWKVAMFVPSPKGRLTLPKQLDIHLNDVNAARLICIIAFRLPGEK